MTWMRVLLAASLLDERSRSIGQVARICGFSSDSALRRAVGGLAGMSPRELRRRGAFSTAGAAFAAALAQSTPRIEGRPDGSGSHP
jgi:transcriptional regulator GlxA family with amidase domain